MSAPVNNTIPDLVRIGTVPSDTNINVETSILDPVSFSQSRCHFVLANKGILHSNSRITLSPSNTVSGSFAAGDRAFWPVGVGVHSLISRCRLAIGGKTVSEIEDFSNWMGYDSMFIPNETNKEREQVMNGRCMNVTPTLEERGGATETFGNASNSASNSESVTEAQAIQLDNGKDFSYLNNADPNGFPARTATPIPSRAVYAWQEIDNQPIMSILLADLFPFLKMHQLPLYMINEQVSITLTFVPEQDALSDVSTRLCTTLAADLANDVTISQPNCQLIADYIYYPQDMMLRYQEANAQMNFQYLDYQFTKRTVSIADFSGQLIQNLGGAGRYVNKVVVAACNETRAKPQNTMLGDNYSEGPTVTALTAGQVSTNLRYNDLFLYPIDVANSARHFHNIFITEGRVPMVGRDLYSGEGQLTGIPVEGAFEDHGSTIGLRSQFFYTAYRLNHGERVNSRGIELYDTRTTMAGVTTLRAWLQVVRTLTLQDGKVEVGYA